MIEFEFEAFPKLARLSRGMIVTEKLDGTNAQVHVLEDGRLLAGSRNRYLAIGDDNYGFAGWVKEHEDELRTLGPGRHFGEWWGKGIGRNYGLQERRFSLFNVSRWGDARPACCEVVPELMRGPFNTMAIDICVQLLRERGSYAAPGFMKPEGVVVYHVASQTLFKKTCEKDESPKSLESA